MKDKQLTRSVDNLTDTINQLISTIEDLETENDMLQRVIADREEEIEELENQINNFRDSF